MKSWTGWRVSVGPEGSASRVLAVPWLLAESSCVLRGAIQRLQRRIAAEGAGRPPV